MPLLYKYISPENIPGGPPLPLLVLQTMSLIATDPRSFNDPFEVRPWFDQERHDYASRTQESFHESMLGVKNSLIKGQSMAEISTENASGFAEKINKRFRDDIGSKFRVVCLSENPKSVLMWGHYARSHAGIVIGIDPNFADVHRGLKSDGFKVRYSLDRSLTKLPCAYYRSPSVEFFDLQGNIVNHPDEPVESEGGLFIPFREYRRQVEETGITALTTKAQDWQYEQEVRFIYDLSQHSLQLTCEKGRHFVAIPTDALREIIVGFRAAPQLVSEIVSLYREGKSENPRCFIQNVIQIFTRFNRAKPTTNTCSTILILSCPTCETFVIAPSSSGNRFLGPDYGDGRQRHWTDRRDYFFTPRTASFAALATRNLTTVLAGILIFCCVFGLKPTRAFLFCFTSLPNPGKTNSPFFLIAL